MDEYKNEIQTTLKKTLSVLRVPTRLPDSLMQELNLALVFDGAKVVAASVKHIDGKAVWAVIAVTPKGDMHLYVSRGEVRDGKIVYDTDEIVMHTNRDKARALLATHEEQMNDAESLHRNR